MPRSSGFWRNVLLRAFRAQSCDCLHTQDSDDEGRDKSNVASEVRLCMQMTKARVCVGLCASSQAYDSYLRFLVHRDVAHQSELAH